MPAVSVTEVTGRNSYVVTPMFVSTSTTRIGSDGERRQSCPDRPRGGTAVPQTQ